MTETLQHQIIPEITNELGRYWEQPKPKDLLIDDKYALMDPDSFNKLNDYSHSNPTGVYVGKMWKRKWKIKDDFVFLLCWWGYSEEPNRCTFNIREIIVIQ